MDDGVSHHTRIFLWKEVKEGAGIEIHSSFLASSSGKWQFQCPCDLDVRTFQDSYKCYIKSFLLGDFPAGAVVNSLSSQCRGAQVRSLSREQTIAPALGSTGLWRKS